MKCDWDSLLRILPKWMRQDVDEQGKFTLQELRLRLGCMPELVLNGESRWLQRKVEKEDLSSCLLNASRHSPWTADSMRQGYVTAPGGHRVGLCGEAAGNGGMLHQISSVCIRVARDYPGIAGEACPQGSVLILGAPGWGKTTLLRDLIRQRSFREPVAVVDERGELFPQGFDRGLRVDVLSGISKEAGIDRVLRTMGPGCIALDEITARADAEALCRAWGCGTRLLATAHGGSFREFSAGSAGEKLIRSGIFQHCLVLRQDKTYTVEAIT